MQRKLGNVLQRFVNVVKSILEIKLQRFFISTRTHLIDHQLVWCSRARQYRPKAVCRRLLFSVLWTFLFLALVCEGTLKLEHRLKFSWLPWLDWRGRLN